MIQNILESVVDQLDSVYSILPKRIPNLFPYFYQAYMCDVYTEKFYHDSLLQNRQVARKINIFKFLLFPGFHFKGE